MKNYVKIIIEDENKKVLEHHFIRENKWDVPAGKIEDNESPAEAAARELLERTGFAINPKSLEEAGEDSDFYIFKGKKEDLSEVAKPGEKGGYSTSIRWV